MVLWSHLITIMNFERAYFNEHDCWMSIFTALKKLGAPPLVGKLSVAFHWMFLNIFFFYWGCLRRQIINFKQRLALLFQWKAANVNGGLSTCSFSAGLPNWLNDEIIVNPIHVRWRMWESNPGRLGSKRERYLCAMPPRISFLWLSRSQK